MSSKVLRTVLFPEPERPVRMTSWRWWRVECCFTGGAGSALYPALMGAGDAHVFPVFRDRAARDVDAGIIEFLGDLIVGQRLGGIFLLDHLFYQAFQGEQRHAAAFGPVHRLTEERT